MTNEWNFPHEIHTEYNPVINSNRTTEVYGGIVKDSDGDLIFKWLIIDTVTGLKLRPSMNIGWCSAKDGPFLDMERLETFFRIIANQYVDAIVFSRRQMQKAVRSKFLDIKKLVGL